VFSRVLFQWRLADGFLCKASLPRLPACVDFGNLFRDWFLAGHRHVAADVQFFSDAQRAILSVESVKSVVKNAGAFYGG
jgi:hypothetical protein